MTIIPLLYSCLTMPPAHYRNYMVHLIAVLLPLLVSPHVQSNPESMPVLMLQPGVDGPNNIAPWVQYAEDRQHMSIDQMLEHETVFQPINNNSINFGFSASQFWLRFRVKNNGDIPTKWKMEFQTRSRKLLMVYEISGSNPKKLLTYREGDEYEKRLIDDRHLNIDVEFTPRELKEFVVGYQNNFTTRLPILFTTDSSFSAKKNYDAWEFGVFLACMVTLLVINFFQYLAVLHPVYLYYSIMVVLNTLSVCQHDGYNFQYLWPNSPNLDNFMTTALAVLASLSVLTFYRSAVNLRKRSPRFDRALVVFMVIWSLLLPALFVFDLQHVTKTAVILSVPLGLIILVSVSIIAIRKRVEFAYYYTLGWICYFLGATYFHLIHIGFELGSGLYTTTFYRLGIIFEAFIFSMALALQVRSMRKKHFKTQTNYVYLLEGRLEDMEILKKVEHEKIKALEEAQEKTLQIASVSHDIFQPLYTVRAVLSAIKDEVSDKQALTEANRAISYAEDILKESILSSKQYVSAPVAMASVGHIFNDLFTQNYRHAQSKKLKLKFSPTTLYLRGSQTILTRILDNLIKNSIRYSTHGKILCGVRRRRDSIDIQVIDRGPGIDTEDIEELTRPFKQGSGAGQGESGFGLGFGIVTSLCEQQGYQFLVQSKLGVGSVFSIIIPK